MSLHYGLINDANAIDHKYQEVVRIISVDYRRKFRAASKARKAGKTAEADKLSKDGKALQAKLLEATATWQKAHRELDALFLQDEIADKIVAALKKAAEDARGHLKAVRDTGERLKALGQFATFLEKSITTIAKLAG